MNSREILNDILKRLDNTVYISPESIPDIDLYMDQVTTFMDEHLGRNKRHPDDKALTKTMINNYAKNRLLPAPEKKKYSKEHMILLIFIYYYKSLISFADIENIFRPVTDRHFKSAGGSGIKLEDIYKEILSLEKQGISELKDDIIEKFSKAENTFSEYEGEDYEHLRLFAFICELAFDVYMKKQMIERIADCLGKSDNNTKKK